MNVILKHINQKCSPSRPRPFRRCSTVSPNKSYCWYHRLFGSITVSLKLCEKRKSLSVMAITATGSGPGPLLQIFDRSSFMRLLNDTDPYVSSGQHPLCPTILTLQAANGSRIKTYGQKLLKLGLGLGFSWFPTFPTQSTKSAFFQLLVLCLMRNTVFS